MRHPRRTVTSMDALNRIAARPGVIANLVLGAVLAGIIAVEVGATTRSGGPWAFGLTVSVGTALAALLRARNRAWALVTGMVICSAAAAVAVAAELPSEPGFAATAALLVLGASFVRTADPRHGWPAAVAGVMLLVASRTGMRPSLVLPTAFVGVAAWGVALGIGLWLRSLDTHRRAAVQAARRDERLVLARELHDVVAHHVAAIVVHAQAARLAANRHPQKPYEALAEIESAGSDALTAMRRVIGLLRDTGDAAAPAAESEQLSDLVRRFCARGQDVDVRLPDDQTTWPPEVRITVYRVVQESLTNIVRHAPDAHRVTVMVDDNAGALLLEITDDGPHQPPGPAWLSRDGYGLVGMRERVEVLGGSFDAGPRPHGGWGVRASIPLAEAPVSGVTVFGVTV